MIETILITLLVSSLAATGTFFLKWLETKKSIAELQKENSRLQRTVAQLERQKTEVQAQSEKEKVDIRAQAENEKSQLTQEKDQAEAVIRNLQKPKQTFAGYRGSWHRASPI